MFGSMIRLAYCAGSFKTSWELSEAFQVKSVSDSLLEHLQAATWGGKKCRVADPCSKSLLYIE